MLICMLGARLKIKGPGVAGPVTGSSLSAYALTIVSL